MAATLPQLLPHGHRAGIEFQLQVVPRENVMLVPPGKMRTAEDGAVEVLLGNPGEWTKVPDGFVAHELGTPLPPELCDVAVVVCTMVEDMLGPKLLGAAGEKPHGRVSGGPLAVVARAPLDRWQAAHVGALRGPVE
jgi:hypothetical protein